MIRVLIADPGEPRLDAVRKVLPAAEIEVAASFSESDLTAVGGTVDAVICSGIVLTATAICSMPRCKVIARTGTGVDKIALDTANEEGVLVTNTPEYCLAELSDHTIAMMLALARRIVAFNTDVRNGDWFLEAIRPIRRLAGCNLGLIGFGRLARAVVPKARAFGLVIMAYDLYVDPSEIEQCGAKPVPLDQLLRESDFVSLHTALTPETRHLIGESELASMKKSAVLINTSRGGVVDEAALVAALTTGKIAGAALDVLEREPPQAGNPLLSMENVILTPHVAAYSQESMLDAWTQAAQEVKRVLSGEIPQFLVNPKALDAYYEKWGRT